MPPDPPRGCVNLVNLSSKTLDPPLITYIYTSNKLLVYQTDDWQELNTGGKQYVANLSKYRLVILVLNKVIELQDFKLEGNVFQSSAALMKNDFL